MKNTVRKTEEIAKLKNLKSKEIAKMKKNSNLKIVDIG